jgi:hypothetical protein
MAGTSGQVLLGRVSSSFPTTTTTGYFSLDTNNVDGTNGGLTIKTLASNVLTERLRINYLGDVGIGTSSPATRLHVAGGSLTMGAYGGEGGEIQLHNTVGGSGVGLDVDGSNNFRIFNVSNTATIFYTNSTERARITAAGDFLVGTTTNDNTTTGIKLDISPISGSPIVKSVGSSSSNSQDTFHVYSTGAGAYRFYVGYGGTISATSATITALSDQRLKENIQDLDVGLDKIMALQPRKFDWKAGKGTDKKGVRGFIAQEFEQVFPDLIDTWKDPAPEGEEPYKSVRADLIPVLVKAIQEQQALITTLTARVAALESN